ncbi:MAG: rhodanese-like domain-containing protein [Thermoflexales bacterium]|nr:rhodanese-like domain-containing protein [Thermoflexales bacterium]
MKSRSITTLLLAALLAGGMTACAGAPPAPTAVPPTAVPTVAPTPKPALDMTAAVDKFLKGLPDGFNGIKPEALKDQMATAKPFLLDVREASELASGGFIEGAVNIPIRTVAKNLDKLPAKDQPIVVYCAIGHRGAIAATALQLLGYTNVKSISGGFNAWTAAKLPVATGTPNAPVAGAKPTVDAEMLAVLDKYLSGLPDGFNGVKPDAAKEQIEKTKPFVIDVREPSELASAGYIEGSVNIPIRTLSANLSKLPAKDQPIIVYCAIGHRGGMAMAALNLLGYTNVKSISGGFNAWVAANLPVKK